MIGVTGATGKLGKLVIKHLLEKTETSNIVAFSRTLEKAEDLKKLGVQVRIADYDFPDSWTASLQGIKKLLLISSSNIGVREKQHEVVISAAKSAGVQFLAYTSVLRADSTSLALAKEHLATELLIKQSGLSYAFLRNGWYLENHTENLASALQYGAIHGAAKDGKFSSAARDDFALAASNVLTGIGHENKIYELAGDHAFTLTELAAEVSRVSGKTVNYQNHSADEYKKFLESVGLPEGFAYILADSDEGASKGALYSESKDLSKLIGRPTTLLTEAVKRALR